MARRPIASLYLLVRQVPHAAGWSDRPDFYTQSGRGESFVPLTGYPTKEAAEAAQKQLERAARELTPIGPFLGELLPERMSDVAKAATAAGLPVPDYTGAGERPAPTMHGGHRAYSSADYEYGLRVRDVVAAWWANVAADASPEANAALWDALFPEFEFYSVSRVPVEE
jgi:hypothetical protein